MTNEMPYITRERCVCNIDPKGHYHYDRELWIEWFTMSTPKPSYLETREGLKKAIGNGELSEALSLIA